MDENFMQLLTQIKEKLATMEQAMQAQNPDIISDLRFIHTALRKDPENQTLLEESEIIVLVNGLKLQTGEFLATKEVKKRVKKKVTMDDLL